VTREVELLLAVSAWETSPSRADRVRAAAVGVRWEPWLSLIIAHRLVPHAVRQLSAAGVHPAPPVLAELHAASRDAAVRGLALVRQRDALVRAFAHARVPMLPIKGPSLALAAYGDAAARPSIDLDLVVARDDVLRAVNVLRMAGYTSRYGMSPAQERALQSSFGHFEYQHDDAPAKVELHWRFAAPRYPWTMPVADVFARATPADGAAAVVADPHDDLLLQVMHGARHQWAQLEWLVAFAACLERYPVDAARLLALAERHHSRRALRVALALVRELLGVTLVGHLALAAEDDAEARALAAELVAALAVGDANRWIAEPGRFALRQMDGVADRLRYLAHSVVDPTVREWELWQLPDALLPLYYPLRLARLAARPFVRR
jgi:hypothetical protein